MAYFMLKKDYGEDTIEFVYQNKKEGENDERSATGF